MWTRGNQQIFGFLSLIYSTPTNLTILFPRTDLTRVPVETLVRAARKLHTFNINYCKLTDQQKQGLGRK